MKRVKHNIVIDHVTFKTNDNQTISQSFESLQLDKKWGYSNIWNAYDRPSDAKVSIWHEWENWFRRNFDKDHRDYFISSRNGYFFTIEGKIKLDDGTAYYLKITAYNNYAYKLVG